MNISPAASYTKEIFKNLNIENHDARTASFSDCTFSGCRFSCVDFMGASFSDCVFDHSELSLPKLIDVGLHGVTFKDCKLVGVDLTKCSVHLFNISFETCLIDTCNFSSLKLKRTPFIHCTIRESRFIESVLTETNFENSDLEGTLFHQCNLEDANFLKAKNYSIDPTTNNLKNATFSLPEAISLLTRLGIKLE